MQHTRIAPGAERVVGVKRKISFHGAAEHSPAGLFPGGPVVEKDCFAPRGGKQLGAARPGGAGADDGDGGVRSRCHSSIKWTVMVIGNR